MLIAGIQRLPCGTRQNARRIPTASRVIEELDPDEPSELEPSESPCEEVLVQVDHVSRRPLNEFLRLTNRENTCYAAALIHVLDVCSVADYLDLPLDPLNVNLHLALMSVLENGRGRIQALDVIVVVNNLNIVCAPFQEFPIGIQYCALEFADALISSLNMRDGYLSEFHEEGVCVFCGEVVLNLGWGFSAEPRVLKLELPENNVSIDVEEQSKFSYIPFIKSVSLYPFSNIFFWISNTHLYY